MSHIERMRYPTRTVQENGFVGFVIVYRLLGATLIGGIIVKDVERTTTNPTALATKTFAAGSRKMRPRKKLYM